MMRSIGGVAARAIGTAALAAIASACASTGAVPRPFPVPGSHQAPGANDPAPPSTAPDPGAAPASPVPAPAPPAASSRPVFDGYALVGTALSLRGSPYRNGGTDPSGFDCSGFTQYVFGQYGIPLPRDVREQYRFGKSVKAEELTAGDLIFFTTTDPGASHVAIAVGGDEFVHAPSSSGVVRVEHLSSTYWSPRYLGARRVN
jgi:cell wall-associated NlpC family hydrolase